GPNDQAITTGSAVAVSELEIKGIDRELRPRLLSPRRNVYGLYGVHQYSTDPEIESYIKTGILLAGVDWALWQKKNLSALKVRKIPTLEDIETNIDAAHERIIGPVLSQRWVVDALTSYPYLET